MHLHSSRSSRPPTKEEAALPSLPLFFFPSFLRSHPCNHLPPFFHSLLHIKRTRKSHNPSPVPEGRRIPTLRPPPPPLSLAMQPTDTEINEPWSIQDHSLPIVLTFVLILFFIIAFFTLYLFRYVMEYLRTIRQRPVATPRGLPTSIISSFPTFPYSSVKDEDIRHGNDKPECIICLAEFSDDDELRMLTVCSHVFHLECIDLWLQTHTTCPICRRDLDQGNNKKVEVIIQMPESNSGRREGEGEAAAGRHEHRNSFKEDGSDEEGNNNNMGGRMQHREQQLVGQLSGSHWAGNSADGEFMDPQHDQSGRSCTVPADIEVRHGGLLKCEGSFIEIR